MKNTKEENHRWSAHEMKMLTHVEVFLHKPALMKKAEDLLKTLEQSMVEELADSRVDLPPGTRQTSAHLVRGENHNGFPFLSLDIPQMFSKTEMFTYRTLFWWGHYLGFALILKGKNLPSYTDHLIQNKGDSVWSNAYLATAPTPWEWSRTDQHFKNVHTASEDELRGAVASIDYIKLCRFYPVDDASFPSLDWTVAGIDAWRNFSRIARDP